MNVDETRSVCNAELCCVQPSMPTSLDKWRDGFHINIKLDIRLSARRGGVG